TKRGAPAAAPEPPAERPLSVEEARQLLDDLVTSFRQHNYYDALNLKPSATRERIAQAVDGRMRGLQVENYARGVDYEAEEVLHIARQHLQGIGDLLLDPERRAVYECCIGIFTGSDDDQDVDLQAARKHVRQQFHEKFM